MLEMGEDAGHQGHCKNVIEYAAFLRCPEHRSTTSPVIYNATMIADATIVFDGHGIADATMVLGQHHDNLGDRRRRSGNATLRPVPTASR